MVFPKLLLDTGESTYSYKKMERIESDDFSAVRKFLKGLHDSKKYIAISRITR